MRIDLLINGTIKETWDVPDAELGIEADWDFKTRCLHRRVAIGKWLKAMEDTYRPIFAKMGYQVDMQITFGSQVNITEISDKEMEEFKERTSHVVIPKNVMIDDDDLLTLIKADDAP